jgi:hypothetical protein
LGDAQFVQHFFDFPCADNPIQTSPGRPLQGLSRFSSDLDQGRHEVPFACPWDLQVDNPHARIDRAIAKAVAAVLPIRAALVMLGADEL